MRAGHAVSDCHHGGQHVSLAPLAALSPRTIQGRCASCHRRLEVGKPRQEFTALALCAHVDHMSFFFSLSRMRFLTRKWQKAIKRLSLTGTVNGHPSGEMSGRLGSNQGFVSVVVILHAVLFYKNVEKMEKKRLKHV